MEDSSSIKKTIKKRDFRAKAYGPAFKSSYPGLPKSPDDMDWGKYFKNGKPPKYVELGCGYGKFLMNMAKICSDVNCLGFELRQIVYEFVKLKIIEIGLENCAVMEYNALLFLQNILQPKSVEKFFILYPDPRKQPSLRKGRLINKRCFINLEYLMKDSGKLYISTDLQDYNTEIKEEIEEFNKINEHERRFEMIDSKFIKLSKDIEVTIDSTSIESQLIDHCYKKTNEAERAGINTGQAFCLVYQLFRN